MRMKLLFAALLVGSIHSEYLEFQDSLSNEDYGLKVLSIEVNLCHGSQSSQCDSKCEVQLKSRQNYTTTRAVIHAKVTDDASGQSFGIPVPVRQYLHIVSNDTDGEVSTFNNGGIYAYIKHNPLIGLIPVGNYTIEVQIKLDMNDAQSVISDYTFSYERE